MRTRFAPSPTGDLHLGGLRTALYSYCLARKSPEGKFYLRIEDTDIQRTKKGAKDKLIRDLHRCGFEMDGSIVEQSKRIPEYQKVAEKLLDANHAYRCFCSKDRLEALRVTQASQNQPTKYDGKCSHLSKLESHDKVVSGTPYTIRMRSPMTGETVVHDEIIGDIKFSNSNSMEDQVLIKQDGWPTYHLASIVDDHEMDITHVVRGDEWLPSTPKHLTLYRMLNWIPPKYAHLPLLLTPDGKKLSKRSAMGLPVEELLNEGYLPNAILNFVLLLGWGGVHNSSNGSADILLYSKEEMIQKFSLENVTRSGAIVDINRLSWINSMHIRHAISTNDPIAIPIISDHVRRECSEFEDFNEETLQQVFNVLKERVRLPNDFVRLGSHFFKSQCENLMPIPKDIIENKPTALKVIKEASTSLMKLEDLETLHDRLNVKKREVLGPLRWALTGLNNGAPMFDTVKVLGIEKARNRLNIASELLENSLITETK